MKDMKEKQGWGGPLGCNADPTPAKGEQEGGRIGQTEFQTAEHL
jgi:hypothetical protein